MTTQPSLRERLLARVGAALGLPRRSPDTHPELSPLLMPTMMKRFDLDHAALSDNNPDLARLLEGRCRECAVKGLCLEALAHGVTAEGARGFCVNASIFESLGPRKAS